MIDSGKLGRIYYCRMFYGNGTAKDVYNSPWRDTGMGVLTDLGSHLLDTLLYWFEDKRIRFHLERWHRFENQSHDHVIIRSDQEYALDLEMSLLSYRNHFTCDLIGERGSAHIESLCKWGPCTFILRQRKLPSGRPDEEAMTMTQGDPTWKIEYQHFIEMCRTGTSNISNDILINDTFQSLHEEMMVGRR